MSGLQSGEGEGWPMTDLSHSAGFGNPTNWEPRSKYERSRARAATTRVHQCPGCWAVVFVPVDSGDWECDCGQQMTPIDLREQPCRI